MRRVVTAAAGTALTLTLAVAGCGGGAETVKDYSPPIKTIMDQPAPAQDKLKIESSGQVQPDPQKALDNYRKLLALNPDAETSAEATKRIADLRVEMQDNGNGGDKGAALQESISLYNQLLTTHAGEANNDRVLYQLARAYQNSGNVDKAVSTLQQLARQYPTSPLIADARFRAGELLYAKNRFPEAAQEYKAVIALGPATPFYEPGQYKYGWSLYQDGRYAESITVFFTLLDADLPPGQIEDPQAALKGVAPAKTEMVEGSLRVVALSFDALGGGKAMNDYFQQNPEPRFSTMIYASLGKYMLDKQRYNYAADTYAAFIARHPNHPLAPDFESREIAAYTAGGFADQVVSAKAHYVATYDPAAPYWAGKTPTPEVMKDLRSHLDDLAHFYQAKAQKDPATDAAARQADFLAAAKYYKRTLELYPQDPKYAELNYLYADSLYDGGQTKEAADQYMKVAYGDGNHPKTGEAALAAVQAYQRLATEVPPEQHADALRLSVDASIKLADTFPSHPQALPVLTRASLDLYGIKDLDRAVTLANRVLQANPPASDDLRQKALGVIADSRFEQGKFAEAEAADTQLVGMAGSDPKQHQAVVEQLAASIYKQGEAARQAGDMKTAAADFERVGRVTPEASIRMNADYDAAGAYVSMQDWSSAERSLEAFRARYPQSQFNADADKKLATAYDKTKQPAEAAAAYLRIAQRPSESSDTRREAQWAAAVLYDQAHLNAQAAIAYETYLNTYPMPLDRVVQARQRLADYDASGGDHNAYVNQLHAIIQTDDTAGGGRTDQSKLAAAQASLELAREAAAAARAVPITYPITKTLPARKAATQNAVDALNRAAAYGFAEQTTAATYELANVYHDFSKALLASDRPASLNGDALSQYEELLQEQADPIDDQAIKAHEVNLDHVKQGVWNQWVRKSVDALGELSPAKYAKREQRGDVYEQLH